MRVTNSLVTANSNVMATVQSNDVNMKSAQAVAGAGFIDLFADTAPAAECRVGFVVFN